MTAVKFRNGRGLREGSKEVYKCRILTVYERVGSVITSSNGKGEVDLKLSGNEEYGGIRKLIKSRGEH